jgi:hypothetical protein
VPYRKPSPSIRVPALLLLTAGLAVILATRINAHPGANSRHLALAFIALALVCGLVAWHLGTRAPLASLASPPLDTRRWRTLASPFVAHPRLTLSILILLHVAVAGLYNHHHSSADIDTFTFQRDAAATLLHGTNPYGGTQANPYNPAQTAAYYSQQVISTDGTRVLVGLQYPPLTLLWAVPGYLLGNVCFSYIAAIVLAALFTFALSPRGWGLPFAAFLLICPLTFKVENRCWTEPLTLLALTATVYAAVNGRRWLPLALGLLLASKQYNVLALPFISLLVMPFQWRACLRLMTLSLLVAAATILPFAWPHPYALWHDLVLFHLRQPFRPDALSFAVPFPVMQKLGPLLLLCFIAWTLLRRYARPAFFAAAYALALLLFFATSKQAFDNYFFLIAQAFLLAVPALLAPVGIPSGSKEIMQPC